MTVFHPIPSGETGCAECHQTTLEVVYDVREIGPFGVGPLERAVALYCRPCKLYYEAGNVTWELARPVE